MLEPVSRSVSLDVFGFHSVFANKFLDSYSVFDWGRMPDSIPLRGKFQAYLQTYLNQKLSSLEEWKHFLRSPDALAFRKAGIVTAHLNELGDSFPMKSSHFGAVTEENFFAGKMETTLMTTEQVRKGIAFYLLSDAYAEEKVGYATVLGKTAWDFTAWKNKKGPKALPFELVCVFGGDQHRDFPSVKLVCNQAHFSTEISFTEALLITDLPAKKLEEAILRATWIAGFSKFQMKSFAMSEKMTIRIRMGMDDVHPSSDFVFLGSIVEFPEIEESLQKYYASTVWGKVVNDLQTQARVRGDSDWKRQCTEPAPWLDRELKNNFSNEYLKMISGIAACLSE